MPIIEIKIILRFLIDSEMIIETNQVSLKNLVCQKVGKDNNETNKFQKT